MAKSVRWCVVALSLCAFAAAPAAADSSLSTESLPWSVRGPGHVDLKSVSCPTAERCVAVGDIAVQRSAPAVATYSAGHWRATILPIPSGGAYAQLERVSCPTAAWCAAVGVYYLDQYHTVPFSAVLTGGIWTESVLPVPDGGAGLLINGISCPAPGTCVTAGGYTDTTGHAVGSVESLSDGSWSIGDLPQTPNAKAYLTGVDCAAVNACTAVGARNDLRLVADTLTEAGWHSAALPGPSGSTSVTPAGISCAATDRCMFVGTYTDAAYDSHPFAEELADGSRTVRTLPQPPSDVVDEFTGITCPDATDCFAVGSGAGSPFVATFSDASWTTGSLPVPTYDTSIEDVACYSATECMAVGWRVAYPTNPAVIDVLTSGAWTTRSLHLSGAPDALLSGVSCLAAADCLAVGSYPDSAARTAVMTETLGSSGWAAASVPAFAGVDPISTYGVGCTSVDSCVATARASVDGSDDLVAYVRDEGTWQRPQTLASVGTAYHVSAPVCPASGSCTSVASYLGSDGIVHNVAFTLAGGAWTATELPIPTDGRYAFIWSVSCASATSCVAIGSFENGSSNALYADTLVNGTWTATALPRIHGAGSPLLESVSCPTSSWCMAVGRDGDRTIVDRYSDGTWNGHTVPVPDGSYEQELVSVSCRSRGTCTAVGTDTDATTRDERPLVSTFTAGAWQQHISSIPAGGIEGVLRGVSCAAAHRCIAVGDYTGSDGGEHPFAVNVQI